MNPAHFHLALNHFPLILPMIGIIVMLIGFMIKSDPVKRTALFLFLLGALATFPTMFSGEGAEEVVEQLNDASKAFIHEHEEAAEFFAVLSYVLGLIAAVGLWASIKQKTFSNALSMLTILYVLFMLFFAKEAATTGGEIAHPEIRSSVQQAPSLKKTDDD
jgi:uncharacterized membrane protein